MVAPASYYARCVSYGSDSPEWTRFKGTTRPSTTGASSQVPIYVYVVDRLCEMGLRQPLVVMYGQSRKQFSVFCNAIEILCGESFIEAVVVALACHFLFHLRFDSEVADIWGVFSLLIGAPHSVKSNTAINLVDSIQKHLV